MYNKRKYLFYRKPTKTKATNIQIDTLKKKMALRPWLYDCKYGDQEWLLLSDKLNKIPNGTVKTIQQWKKSKPSEIFFYSKIFLLDTITITFCKLRIFPLFCCSRK